METYHEAEQKLLTLIAANQGGINLIGARHALTLLREHKEKWIERDRFEFARQARESAARGARQQAAGLQAAGLYHQSQRQAFAQQSGLGGLGGLAGLGVGQGLEQQAAAGYTAFGDRLAAFGYFVSRAPEPKPKAEPEFIPADADLPKGIKDI